MKYQERLALFREHAAAVLRRDQAGVDRLGARIGSDLYLHHQLFVFTLFASAVTDHFGDELDRAELGDLMAELRSARPGLHWLQAEALIRLCYDESGLYMEVPQSEHPQLMWAVLALIVPPDPNETTLAVLFDRADELGREVVSRVFETERLFGWADEPEETEDPQPETEDQTEAKTRTQTRTRTEAHTETEEEP